MVLARNLPMIIVYMGTEGPIYRGSCPMEKGMGGYGDMGILKVMLDALLLSLRSLGTSF